MPPSTSRAGNPLDNEIERFISQCSSRWNELDALLNGMHDQSLKKQGREQLQNLMRLYRLASSDLNQARSFTSNPELLERLNHLVGRAYRIIYQAAPQTLRRRTLLDFFTRDAPETCRRQARWVALSAGAFCLGTIMGLLLVLLRPSNGELLIPREFFTESPADRVEHIEENKERVDSVATAAAFGSSLYTHNIQVSFLAFALGAATLVGGLFLMFYNGLILGALGGLYIIDGVGTFFLAWVGPHGSLELPSIILAGAAGMCLGRAILVPGETGRSHAVRLIIPDVVRMLFTSCVVLVAAGLIEGSISQFSTKTVSYGIKIAIAVILFSALLGWLFLSRKGSRHA